MLISKKSMQEAEYIVLEVQGGIGKNIMATAVVRNLKKAYPEKKIIVLAGSPDVFLKNPNIKRTYHFAQALYVYEDYFKEAKAVMLSVEPYRHFDYIKKKRHLVECWCEQIDIPCDSVYPEIFLSENEKAMAQLYLEQFDKEMVLFQGEGGKDPKDKTNKEKIIASSSMYKRNLTRKTMDEITAGLIDRGFMVGVVSSPNQYLPSKAERITFSVRAILALIPHVAETICIDSFLLHGTAMFKKKCLSLWGGTNPKCLGYDINVNLTRQVCDNPMCHRPNSFLFDVESTGFPWDCQHNDACMDYKAEEILKAFDEMTGGRRGQKRERPKIESEPKPKCSGGCNPDKVGDSHEDTGLEESSGGVTAKVSAGEGSDRDT